MNMRQRMWLSAALFVIGATIASVALEWDARTEPGSGIPVIVLFNATRVPPCHDGANDCQPWERIGQSPDTRRFAQALEAEHQGRLSPEKTALLAEARRRGLIPPPGFVVVERVREGIYVRRAWGTSALVWGGLLPLVLFAGAGFVALGGGERRP